MDTKIKPVQKVSVVNTMPSLSSIRELFDDGFRSGAREGWKYLFARSAVAPYSKSLLGETLHQKLYMYPRLGYWPQIREPRTFNEKLMHRKLYTHDERFAVVADKWRVREYVAERVGDDVLTDVYHVTDVPDTIPFGSLPDRFVVKPTHLSGPIIFVDDHEPVDQDAITDTCRDWLAETHAEVKGEYWNSEIDPQILVEEQLRDDEHEIPLDFKFFVFHGRVEYIEVDFDRFSGHTRRFYDRDWTPQQFTLEYPLGPEIAKPDRLAEMIEIAEALGEDFDFIRVDVFQPNGERVVFGEMTVAPESGGGRFVPQEYDFGFGELW